MARIESRDLESIAPSLSSSASYSVQQNSVLHGLLSIRVDFMHELLWAGIIPFCILPVPPHYRFIFLSQKRLSQSRFFSEALLSDGVLTILLYFRHFMYI